MVLTIGGCIICEECITGWTEPGYYHAGAFGIRIENVYIVRACKTEHSADFLEFESCTLVPIDVTLVDKALPTRDEVP